MQHDVETAVLAVGRVFHPLAGRDALAVSGRGVLARLLVHPRARLDGQAQRGAHDCTGSAGRQERGADASSHDHTGRGEGLGGASLCERVAPEARAPDLVHPAQAGALAALVPGTAAVPAELVLAVPAGHVPAPFRLLDVRLARGAALHALTGRAAASFPRDERAADHDAGQHARVLAVAVHAGSPVAALAQRLLAVIGLRQQVLAAGRRAEEQIGIGGNLPSLRNSPVELQLRGSVRQDGGDLLVGKDVSAAAKPPDISIVVQRAALNSRNDCPEKPPRAEDEKFRSETRILSAKTAETSVKQPCTAHLTFACSPCSTNPRSSPGSVRRRG